MRLSEFDQERSYIFQALSEPPLSCGSIPYEPLGVKAPCEDGNADMPLVSIITVAYNAAEMIDKAIQSVAGQNYPNIEYIIVDGGSTDDTLSIVRRNAPYVDGLISEQDDGIYDAMNKGLRRARGRYIALLNADDQLYPEFVRSSVAALTVSDADISYCDYNTEDSTVHVGAINDGLFVSQLGIKHNTFLMHRRCFEKVGGFDARLQVVADAKWNRAAFAAGLRFQKIEGVHVFYSLLGLSAGSTPAGRDKIIRESADLILDSFPQLDRDQATSIYLSNFNTHQHTKIINLHRKMSVDAPLLSEMIARSIRWNLENRPGYQLNADDPDQTIRVLELADHFGVPAASLKYQTGQENSEKNAALRRFFETLDRAEAHVAETGTNVCLHFARVFSAPSETFIYDLLTDLDASNDGFSHVMLCDNRKDAERRPFDLLFHVPWQMLGAKLAAKLYGLIWDRLAPKRVVAHFALNGWVLHDRLTAKQRNVQWVNMCHGIDVFAYGDNPNYTAYIDQYCALAPHVAFTVVSQFLADLLKKAGIPETKIFYVPNAVADTFADHRKVDGFWDGTRPLRLVSVGRLIRWKGHSVLIEALSKIRALRPDLQVELDIVYGHWDQELKSLTSQRDSLALPGPVRFIEYVDLRLEPEFLSGYDLFVLPSTTSDDAQPRTETFGVAMIEAISAGLPVIGTTAGGIPEVIGTSGPHAGLVPHGDAQALADAILERIDTPHQTFTDNSTYRDNRMDVFSPAKRLERWGKVDAWLKQPRKKVFHFCALGKGGAAGASINVHKGLLALGYDSWFVTRAHELDHFSKYAANVVGLEPENSIDYNHTEPPRRPEFTTYSVDDHLISDATLRDLLADADLINLTWPAKFLSVQNITIMTRLGVPVMMTLRDMNQITGGSHFFHGSTQWMQGEVHCPQRPDTVPDDYPKLVFEAKRLAWNFDAITFVGLSDHSMDILARSPLSRDAHRIKLPNYVDQSVFFHEPHATLPAFSDIPKDTLKIGYLPSFGSRIKGHRHLLRALRLMRAKRPDLKVVLCLASNDTIPPDDLPYELVQVGALDARTDLRAFYNSVDIVAVPSLEETFSNTTIEALACGVPVVGFKTGILQEILADGTCGYCANMEDVNEMADGFLAIADKRPDPLRIVDRVTKEFSQDIRMADYHTKITELLTNPPKADVPVSAEGLAAIVALTEGQQRIKALESLSRLLYMRSELRNIRNKVETLNNSTFSQSADEELEKLKEQARQATENAWHLSQEVDALRSSTSWRITEPLRFLVRGVRALTGRN